MMNQNPGLRDFFASGFYEEYWPEADDPGSVKAHAAQVLSLLNASQGHILDWRGGHGRYAIWFARAGLQVTLLDFMREYLDAAKSLFDEAALPVRLIEVDSRNTPRDIEADFAVCLNSSVGFMSEDEEVKAFASLNAALRPGARLLLDCMNLFSLMKPIAGCAIENRGDDGCIRRSEGRFDFETNVWHKTFELVKPDGTSVRREFNQTIYTPQQLVSLLRHAGFTTERVLGDFDGSPISFDSRKIVMIVRKE
ncbi:MAG: class I SAM-dependent methyltransferase [bacterium]|nr:class I SAM-dependent methyltransferase [bacterium]